MNKNRHNSLTTILKDVDSTALLEHLGEVADAYYDGHLNIGKIESGWCITLGAPDEAFRAGFGSSKGLPFVKAALMVLLQAEASVDEIELFLEEDSKRMNAWEPLELQVKKNHHV